MATVPIGQAPQAVVYVPGAVPEGTGTALGNAAMTVANTMPSTSRKRAERRGCSRSASPARRVLTMVAAGSKAANERGKAPTSVALFDQGLIQVLEAAVTGLQPNQPHVLALAGQKDGSGALEPLASFTTNQAGSAIVNAIGPIRQVVEATAPAPRRYLVIAAGSATQLGATE